MKKNRCMHAIFCWMCLFCVPGFSQGTEGPLLRIGGLVQSPLHLSFSDLQQFRMENLSAYEATGTKGSAAGKLHAVALRSLMELAKIQGSMQDLAISIKNIQGEQAVFSGGEVLMEARNRFFIAGPAGTADGTVGDIFPALIIVNDHRMRVALRQVTFIEAVSVAQAASNPADSRKSGMPASIQGALYKTASVAGYRVPSVLDQAGLKPASTDILRFTARDGNAITVSTEELTNDAGIAGKERRVQTSLSEAMERTETEKESFLGLVYIGRDLKPSNSEK